MSDHGIPMFRRDEVADAPVARLMLFHAQALRYFCIRTGGGDDFVMGSHDGENDSRELAEGASETLRGPGDHWGTLPQRLRWARQRAGFPSIAAAARAFNFHKQNLADHEAGRRKVSPDRVVEYAQAFHVNAGWLLTGAGSPLYERSEIFAEQQRPWTKQVILLGELDRWYEIADASMPWEGIVGLSFPHLGQVDLFAVRVGRDQGAEVPAGSILVWCDAAAVDFDASYRVLAEESGEFYRYVLRRGPGDDVVGPRAEEYIPGGKVVGLIRPMDPRVGPAIAPRHLDPER